MKTTKFPIILFVLLIFLVACEKDDGPSPDPAPADNPAAVSLPTTISGQVVNMKFTAPQSGAPYTLDQEVRFTFSSSGKLFLDTDPAASNGDEVSIDSFTKEGNEYVWTDAMQSLSYKLSLKADSSINEVNLFSSANAFLGQFVPIDTTASGGIDLVKQFAANYNVTAVNKGSHSRMTVSIDANGNIDFDNGVQLSAADYNLISDKISCCNSIFIDVNPYPTQPYPRVNLLLDASGQNLIDIEYYPSYPNVSGRTFVSVSKNTGGGSSNQLTISGDTAKIGGPSYNPPVGLKCTSCSNDKYTWDQSAMPNRVLSIEFIARGTVLVEFSGSSAFAASGSLTALGIAHDATAKTFTFTNVLMNEKFSQPGRITLNGTLQYN